MTTKIPVILSSDGIQTYPTDDEQLAANLSSYQKIVTGDGVYPMVATDVGKVIIRTGTGANSITLSEAVSTAMGVVTSGNPVQIGLLLLGYAGASTTVTIGAGLILNGVAGGACVIENTAAKAISAALIKIDETNWALPGYEAV